MNIGVAFMQQLADGGRPTSAKPRDVAGHTWRCYRTGIDQYEWRTDGGRWAVGPYLRAASYWARVDGTVVADAAGHGRRYRSLEGAMKAAVKL